MLGCFFRRPFRPTTVKFRGRLRLTGLLRLIFTSPLPLLLLNERKCEISKIEGSNLMGSLTKFRIVEFINGGVFVSILCNPPKKGGVLPGALLALMLEKR